MRIKKLFVRMLIAVILGLCAGILMEYSSLWTVFPVFLIIGVLACIFVEIVIEVLICAGTITREDLRKIKKPVLRILVATSIGLLAGAVLEYAAIWAAFPFFLILGVLIGFTVEVTIEFVRYSLSMRRAFLEGKGLGLEHLPVNTAELIRQVIKKMRYKKEVCTEVMAELAVHFEDELKDCKTDEEKQGKAQQLIDEFGDTKLLAILLRRAKKRCRPLWRTVVARTFQAVGAFILCFVVYAVWFSTGKPTISVDYLALLNQMNRPEVRDEDNAWPHYEKAMKLYTEPSQRISNLTGGQRKEFKKRLYFSDLKKERQNEIREWLKENEFHWDNLELSQKQLIGRCLEEGLVPLTYAAINRKYSTKRYRVFDEAVEDIIKKIERQQGGRRPDRSSKYEYGMMMEMMSGYGRYQRNQRDIEMDSDIALDSEIITLFSKYSREELEKIERGIEVGVIKAWIDSPPVVAKSLFGYLLPFEQKLIVKWVEENEAAWQEYVAGSSKSYCYNEYRYHDKEEGRFLWNISWSHLIVVRQLSRLGVWQSRIDLEQGRTKQAVEDCLAVTRTGSHWQRKRTLIEQLIGMGIGSIANDGIFHIVANQRFSITELEQLQIQLSQIYQEDYPFMDKEYQKLAFLDVVQHSFTDGGPGGGHLIPRKEAFFDDMYEDVVGMTEDIPFGRGFFKNATLTSMCLLHARRDATVEFGRQIYDKQDMVARMSPYERHERNLISTEEIILPMPRYRYALLYHLLPAVDRVSDLFYRGKALHEAIIAILAIQRWRLEKDGYPATLDELIEAGYLKELPMDPYSDKALIYKKTGDNFVLYSVGNNFKDDGGVSGTDSKGQARPWMDGDMVFWPVAKPQVK